MNQNIRSWGILTFLVSLCSYVYELLLIQFAGELTNNNFLIINLSLGTFILGLGLGLKELPPSLTRDEALLRLLKVERSLCLTALLSWGLIQGADFLQQHFMGLILTKEITSPFLVTIIDQYHFYVLIGSVLASLLIGVNSGQELPLILTIVESGELEQRHTALFFSLNYLGSVVAAISLNYLLKPWLSAEGILALVVSVNLFIFLFLRHKLQSKLSIIFSVLALATFIGSQETILQFNLKNYYYHFSSLSLDPSSFKAVRTSETAYQKIHIYQSTQNKTILSLNRQFQFSFNHEDLYHDALVHFPLKMTGKKPRNALLLGGGDGLALRELLRFPSLKIKQIELDEEFTNFCRTERDISKLNAGSLSNTTQVKRIYGDAFSLVKRENTKYDLIIVDFPYPFSYDLWKLYSLEFYLSLKKRLNEGGILVLDAPVQNSVISKFIKSTRSEKLNSTIYSTLKKAGFETIELFSLQKEGFVIAGVEKLSLERNFSDTSFLKENTLKRLPDFRSEVFNYYYDEKLVNSIFRPKFLDFTRDF